MSRTFLKQMKNDIWRDWTTLLKNWKWGNVIGDNTVIGGRNVTEEKKDRKTFGFLYK